jgi:hypothetical protein
MAATVAFERPCFGLRTTAWRGLAAGVKRYLTPSWKILKNN